MEDRKDDEEEWPQNHDDDNGDDGEEEEFDGDGGEAAKTSDGGARGQTAASANRGWLWVLLVTVATLVGRRVLTGAFGKFVLCVFSFCSRINYNLSPWIEREVG